MAISVSEPGGLDEGKGPSGRPYALYVFWAVFAGCLALRFGYVLHNSPFDHLFSDPNRHWLNGKRFFGPDLMGSIDPLLYQVWLKGLQWLDRGDGYVVLAATGLLSAALPLFWYKALREVVPVGWALAGALAIGFMPSLFTIYSYFMTETLLLVLTACGFWLTLRAMRTRGAPTLVAVALVWTLAAFTRIVALPLAVLCFAALLGTLAWGKRLALVAGIAVFSGAIAVPACWHSSRNLHFCAPFGSGYFNEIYRASGAQVLRMNVLTKGEWIFSSPSLHTLPLAPLSSWHSAREGTDWIEIDPAKGRADWERAVRTIREGGPRLSWLDDKIENAVMLFFDPSWPDSNRDYAWGWLTYVNRWLWLPLTLAVTLLMLYVRPTVRDALIPGSALALIALLLVQTNGVMEGRYRKPVEPLLVAGAFLLVHRLRNAGKLAADLPVHSLT